MVISKLGLHGNLGIVLLAAGMNHLCRNHHRVVREGRRRA